MKKFKIFIPTVLALMTISTMSVNANPISTLPVNTNEGSSIISLAEEVEWYYRYNSEDVLQKRLWSITYGYWLTTGLIANTRDKFHGILTIFFEKWN